MTAPVYVFISTGKSRRAAVPNYAKTQAEFNRRVRVVLNADANITTVAPPGTLMFRLTEDAVAGHVLCDGSVLNMIDFPELGTYLGTTFGGDGVTTFGLPNYYDDVIAVPSLGVVQTVSTGGTVSTGAPVIQPTQPGQTGGTTGGNIPTGGRSRPRGQIQ